MTEEAMLFRRVQEGCWEAFDVLFHTYAEQLFFYAMGFVNNREEARDIVQGTFITLWEQDSVYGGYLSLFVTFGEKCLS